MLDILSELEKLKEYSSDERREKLGINTKYRVIGVSVPKIRSLSRKIGKNHDLAQRLWKTGVHEAMILSSMIADPSRLNCNDLDVMVKDIDNWELCDQCVINLFWKNDCAIKKALEWSKSGEEFTKRAGFALMAKLASSRKDLEDSIFAKFLEIIKEESTDDRYYVMKSVNWALRQIGKRNYILHTRAVNTAKEILLFDSKSARWIGNNALKELESDKIKERIRRMREPL